MMNVRVVPISVRGGLLLGIALAVLWLAMNASPAMAQPGGPVFISGDDADDNFHCQGTACGGVYPALLSSVVNNSLSPGVGIVAIGVNGNTALNGFNSWNAVANGGPGAPVTFINATIGPGSIATVNFNNFKALYIPSNNLNTFGGITNAQIAALNLRQLAIQSFVNVSGGGLLALTEAGSVGKYGWLPLALTEANKTHSSGVIPTPALQVIAPGVNNANLNHGCCYHTIFTGPAGFSGLSVLAFHPHDGNLTFDTRCTAASGAGSLNCDDVVILGGQKVVLQGQITLDPQQSTNPVGTQHTVTATVRDTAVPTPQPIAGELVTFTIISGPNAGAAGVCSVNADCTTDPGGQVSWTYTDTGGPSPPDDIIQASFTNGTGVLRLITANKEWVAGDTTPPRCEVIGVIGGDLHVEVEDSAAPVSRRSTSSWTTTRT